MSTLIIQLFAGICKAHAPVRVQALGPELAVERLDEAVVCRLARSREVQRGLLGAGPQIEISGDKFAAVVDPYGFRIETRGYSYLAILKFEKEGRNARDVVCGPQSVAIMFSEHFDA